MVNKLAGKASSPNELSYTDEEGRIISGATLAPGPDVIPTRIWKEYAAELANIQHLYCIRLLPYIKRVRVLEIHPTQPRGGHPSHSNLVRGKLTSPTPNPAGDGTSGLTSYPRRRSKVSEATCLRPQRSAPSRT